MSDNRIVYDTYIFTIFATEQSTLTNAQHIEGNIVTVYDLYLESNLHFTKQKFPEIFLTKHTLGTN